MNRAIIFFIFLSLIPTFNNQAMESIIDYRLATQDDVKDILTLIEKRETNDNTKIVILPNKFIENAFKDAINKKRIFVAHDKINQQIIGYKKLFIIDNLQEQQEILEHELRAYGPNAQLATFGLIHSNATFEPSSYEDNDYLQHICIYNGGDLTHPNYRAKGINYQLTNAALDIISEPLKKILKQNNYNAISLLYGLTESNAGKHPGDAIDRTRSIACSYLLFLNKLFSKNKIQLCVYARYKSFMPTFDPNADECKPLSDKYAVPGYGCLLSYDLTDINHEKK